MAALLQLLTLLQDVPSASRSHLQALVQLLEKDDPCLGPGERISTKALELAAPLVEQECIFVALQALVGEDVQLQDLAVNPGHGFHSALRRRNVGSSPGLQRRVHLLTGVLRPVYGVHRKHLDQKQAASSRQPTNQRSARGSVQDLTSGINTVRITAHWGNCGA